MNRDVAQQALPPDYVAALNLDTDPFQDRHELRFFYADPVLMQRLDLLQHLTRFSEQLLYVRAPEGAGKTMLLHQLRLRAADNWHTCQLDAAAMASPAELYVQLSRCFPDAAAENTEHFGSDLIHYCLGLQQSGQLAVLVIDDAERLPGPVFEALLGLARSPAETLKALRILVFATPALDTTLQSLVLSSPGDALVHTLDLPPFDEQQSAAYLMYRLAIAGYSGDSPFSATEVRAMHKTAAGRPGELNRLARETLLEQNPQRAGQRAAAGSGRRPRRGVRVAGTALTVAALIVGGFWYLANRAPELPLLSEQTVQLPPANSLAPPADTPPAVGDPEPDTRPPETPDRSGTDAAPVPQALPQAPDMPEPEAPADEPASIPEPTPEPAPDAPEAADPERPAAAGSPAATATPEEDVPEAPRETAEPAAPAEADATAAPPAAPDWLTAQPDGHYTLQLLGAREPETVERFLARHGERAELHSIRTWRGDAAWHIVVTGSYPDRSAATAALAALPETLRKLQPWPRRFEQIRAELPPE